jgi:hypothetical protein
MSTIYKKKGGNFGKKRKGRAKCLKKQCKFVQKGRIFKILKKFSVKLFTIKSFCDIIIIGRKKDFFSREKRA